MKNQIEFITCVAGDWEVLKLNGVIVAEGHKIHEDEWLGLLKQEFGCEVMETELSDEDMEMGNY